ncbi:MAG: Maf family protein [Bacteroidota bacterium]
MLPNIISDRNIILGSGSPRRAELLASLGIKFEVRVSDVDEIVPPDLDVSAHAAYLSKLKSDALRPHLEPLDILITADTTVLLDDIIYNKPQDREEAIEMIHALCGTTHQVITGMTIADHRRSETISDEALVYLNELSAREVEYYVDIWKPMDKAGAYGIQDWIGLAAISEIRGSYYTIMGLPTHRLYSLLRNWI